MKYIIDIPDERESDYIAETPFGKRLFFPLRITDVAYSIPTHLHVEEYIDVNREEIENEVWVVRYTGELWFRPDENTMIKVQKFSEKMDRDAVEFIKEKGLKYEI